MPVISRYVAKFDFYGYQVTPEMKKHCYLCRDEHIPAKPVFPAIDAHNHSWGNWNAEQIANVTDTVGVVSYCDVTAISPYAALALKNALLEIFDKKFNLMVI